MRILVIDDHKLFTYGLNLLLRQLSENIEVVIINDLKNGLAEINRTPDFDLLLLDIHMPKSNGLSILTHINENSLLIPTVIISATDDIQRVRNAFNLGALGFIPKSYNSNEFLNAIKQVLNGNHYAPSIIKEKLDRLSKGQSTRNYNTQRSTPFQITKRQLEVLTLMAKGYSNENIANTLFLSKNTVKTHVAALFCNLQAKNRTECVRLGQKYGILN